MRGENIVNVKECERCEHYERRVWTQYYKPKDYHPIGMSHAYAYCKYHRWRCSEIAKCNRKEKPNDPR